MKQEFTERESEYIEYMQESPATTEALMMQFSAKRRAVYQILYTLRLKRSVQAVKDAGVVHWQVVDDPTSMPPSRLTEHRRRHLEFMLEPRTTRDVMARFACSYDVAIWNIRTIRLMGYVEYVNRHWHITPDGLAVLEEKDDRKV